MRDSAPAESRGTGEKKTPGRGRHERVGRGYEGGAGAKLLVENAYVGEEHS